MPFWNSYLAERHASRLATLGNAIRRAGDNPLEL